jgi:hypothetical protein
MALPTTRCSPKRSHSRCAAIPVRLLSFPPLRPPSPSPSPSAAQRERWESRLPVCAAAAHHGLGGSGYLRSEYNCKQQQHLGPLDKTQHR